MQFWFDPHDGDRLFAVFCMDVFPSEEEQQSLFYDNPEHLLRAYEMEVFDITNAFRVANGKPAVLHNQRASRAAHAHAKDMADRDFVDHIDPEGLDPMERLEVHGIYAYHVSENIAGGFTNAMLVVQAWVESATHRQGMLEDSRYLGVGAYYKRASRFGFYFVQEFITMEPPLRRT
jgi:uncharacterized protein YkwD